MGQGPLTQRYTMDITDFFAHKRFNVGKRVEVMPRTRTRYVENASQSYGVPLVPEKVLFILDDTLLGSGRDGCVIAIMGIAFKGMFQQPIYFPFDKIEKIQVIGRAVVVNQDAYMQEFSVVGEQDLQAVFLAVKEWLDYRQAMYSLRNCVPIYMASFSIHLAEAAK